VRTSFICRWKLLERTVCGVTSRERIIVELTDQIAGILEEGFEPRHRFLARDQAPVGELRMPGQELLDRGDLLGRGIGLEVDVDARLPLPLRDGALEVLGDEKKKSEDEERERDHGDSDEAGALRGPDPANRFAEEVSDGAGGDFGLVEAFEFAGHQEEAIPNSVSPRLAGRSGTGSFSSMIFP
jgi:hypothetical protein